MRTVFRALAALVFAMIQAAAVAAPALQACRLEGVPYEALCGAVARPLDPAQPQGPSIDVKFAVLPAIARRKLPDPVFFLAGGPGQSAIELAGLIGRRATRLQNRRDIVLVDQRGTGRSAPLRCERDDPTRPLAEQFDIGRQIERLRSCMTALQQLPHGDLRQYTTTIAMADIDAVRAALGAQRIDIVGGSYGTRAALEYMRQFPQRVRRALLDGVAPPDMVLPASFSADNQTAFDALLGWCEADADCRRRHPALRNEWQALLVSLPRDVTMAHPFTGRPEALHVDRDAVLGLVRSPLYSPALAAALPQAVSEAARGRFQGLVGVAGALTSGEGPAEGMHFSVVCAEDYPRLPQSGDRPGRDFGESFANLYRAVCERWPRGAVPAAFYAVPPAPAATLLLSGGIDPVTPPRHAERVARALGAKALHLVVPNGGHGVMGLPCMPDVLYRFISAESDDDALKVDASCATGIPRPSLFVGVEAP